MPLRPWQFLHYPNFVLFPVGHGFNTLPVRCGKKTIGNIRVESPKSFQESIRRDKDARSRVSKNRASWQGHRACPYGRPTEVRQAGAKIETRITNYAAGEGVQLLAVTLPVDDMRNLTMKRGELAAFRERKPPAVPKHAVRP